MTRSIKQLAGALTLAAVFALGAAQAAEASTSANATIFNQVTVEYQSGTTVLTASADVSVTVATLAAAPMVYVNTVAQTTTAGTAIDYIYTVRSNSNGPDTYTLTTPVTSANTGISVPTNTPDVGSVALWGGIVLSSGAGTINLPGGSAVGLAVNDTVELTVGGSAQRYTVTTINPGSAATASAAEVQAVLTLTPIGGAAAITASNVTTGTQIGEYAVIILQQTAGTPTTAGTDGTHVTNLTFTTTATDSSDVVVIYATSAGSNNEVTTTVSSPSLSIAKAADKTNAKPGETITYTITVQNTHATAAASNVTVTDPVPTYTSYVANSTRLNGITVSGDGATSPLSGGLSIDANASRTAGAAASGTLNAGETATITFSVSVQ